MSTEQPTLTDFLLARIAEDERHARKLGDTDRRPVLSLATTINHPERLLLECQAKRLIVEEHDLTPSDDGKGEGCYRCEWDKDWGAPNTGGCDTIRFLAAVYADHPDYRQEWRVEA